MAVVARRVNDRHGVPPENVATWQASTPGVAGIDSLHSFAADRRRQQPRDTEPVPHQGDIPYPGPWNNPRLSPVASQSEWDQRNPRAELIREGKVIQEPFGYPEDVNHPLAPINPAVGARNTGRMPNRPTTQLVGPPTYTLMRRFEPWYPLARRFTGQHVSFASPPTAQIGDYGTGRGPKRPRRTTQRVIPTPDTLQEFSVVEQSRQGTLVPNGSSLQRYW